MHVTKVVPLLALVSLGLLAMLPLVTAHPISPNLNWSSSSSGIPTGGTVTATFGVADVLPGGNSSDIDCPAGAFFSGTLTVTTPGGTVSTHTVANIPCGTVNLTAIYPTQFTATGHTPANSTSGTYTANWAGSTTALIGGLHPSFSITDNFVANQLPPPPTVPEFGAPAILVAAIGLVVVAAMKKANLLRA